MLKNNVILKAVEISDLVKTPSSLLIFADLTKKKHFFHFYYNVWFVYTVHIVA